MGLQSIWRLLLGEPRSPSPPIPLSPEQQLLEDENELWESLKSLGEFRWRVLACIGMFNREKMRAHFHPEDPESLPASLLTYLEEFWQRHLLEATGPQFNGMAVVAAGLLTFGRLEMVDYILANLPPERIPNGWCNTLAFRIASRVLPVPDPLANHFDWFEGNHVANEVRAWFAENRERLGWNELEQRFVLNTDLKR